jgi:hypothetical protein
MTLWTFLVIGWAIAYATRKTPVDPDVEFERTHPRPPLRPQPSKTRVCAPAPAKPPSTVAHQPKPVTVFASVVAPKPPTAKAPVVVTVSTRIPQWTDLNQALHEIRTPSVPVAPVCAPPPTRVAVQTPIAVKPPTARAAVVVTVSTRVRLDALAALRRLGFSQKDAQAQLDTSLGLAIQQSLQKG